MSITHIMDWVFRAPLGVNALRNDGGTTEREDY